MHVLTTSLKQKFTLFFIFFNDLNLNEIVLSPLACRKIVLKTSVTNDVLWVLSL